MDIKIVEFQETKVAVMQHRGAPDRVYDSVARFIEWRKQSKLSPVNSCHTFGIAYDDPKTTRHRSIDSISAAASTRACPRARKA